jgi:HEAT repeat protein
VWNNVDLQNNPWRNIMMTVPSRIDTKAGVDSLVNDLANKDPVVRQRARESLVTLRTNEVTAALVAELTDPREHVRWEAAKALSALKDPVSAPALVNALEDENGDVRWLAAEGLISLGKTGLMAVLSGLEKRAGSTTFCQNAHHVLHGCSREGNAKTIAPVLVALSESEPGVSAPPAAYAALLALKVGLRPKP